jgi:hypothetical protein
MRGPSLPELLPGGGTTGALTRGIFKPSNIDRLPEKGWSVKKTNEWEGDLVPRELPDSLVISEPSARDGNGFLITVMLRFLKQ